MIRISKEIGIDEKDLIIIVNLYWRQTTVLNTDGETTDLRNSTKNETKMYSFTHLV